MNEISNDLIESLKTMGLAEYEAKVYSTLVLFERAEVKKIYEYLNVPKPSVYQSLKSLMDKGLVMRVSSKPAIYRAIPPKIALRHLIEIHENAEKSALRELKNLEKINKESEVSDIIWTLFGENNVEHSIEELILKSETSMKLILPTEYLKYLSFVDNKDLSIELLMFGTDLTLSNQYQLNNLKVHNGYGIDVSDFGILSKYLLDLPLPPKQYSKFIFVLIDNEEFMYVPPYPGKTKSGITSKNPYMIGLMKILFSAIWEHTPDVI
ncbi:TrmB family transcriptional regulator [Methanobacterium alcaliphilum]|uniref:TrmB family transcriptional regulator n=1 Tax=Methanobacterium alcaliphilum TaxID=392018 RepID=UPI00200A9436|nr:helix-turn-helix domain-containing protein [Methanobacterium alcaliphilum]MCK9151783.1 TrmB family transcriptional regulator [Methanobacterium alcaliphilum]